MAVIGTTIEREAKALQELPRHIAIRNHAKKRYDEINSRISEMRSSGYEVSAVVLRQQQALYDAWMPLNREINGVISTLIPPIRKLSQNGRLTQADLRTLSDAGILPVVNGEPTVPGGWGLSGLRGLGIIPVVAIIGISLATAIVAVGLPYAISAGVERIKLASAKANAITAESDAGIAAQEKQWAAQIDAETKAAQIELDAAQKAADKAVSEGKPIPPVLFNAAEKFNALKSIPQSPTSLATGGDGKGNLMGTLVKGGLAVALVVGGIWAFGQRRSKA